MEISDENYKSATKLVSGQTAEARRVFEAAIKREGASIHETAIAVHNVAQTYLVDGDLDRSIENFEKAMDSFRQSNDSHSLAFCLGQCALALRHKARREVAESMLVEVVSIARTLKISRRDTIRWFLKPYFYNLVHLFKAYDEARILRNTLDRAWTGQIP